MSFIDLLQLVFGIISSITVILLFWQTLMQNRLFRAQILKDKFDMYTQCQIPITDERLEIVYANPDRYMPRDVFDTLYKNDRAALRAFLYYDNLYQYLGLRYSMEKIGLPDPNKDALKVWILELLDDPKFLQVHYSNKKYFGQFGIYVDNLIDQNKQHEFSKKINELIED
jgi:hypothetical protein